MNLWRMYDALYCFFVTTWAKSPGIHLRFLPTYSPNLNIIEQLWKFTKKGKFSMPGIMIRQHYFIKQLIPSFKTSTKIIYLICKNY